MDPSLRPSKRPRLSTAATYDNVPDIDKIRRQNDLKLQGRFQAIFNKYDRDFTGLGDEIDIRTLEVVVDNGHLAGMQHETDIVGKRKIGERATARRVVKENFETDELTSGTAKNVRCRMREPALWRPAHMLTSRNRARVQHHLQTA